MKSRIIKKIILALTTLNCCVVYQSQAQQNIQFSQYIFNSISVNPAYAGYKEEWFAQMALRSQWTGISGAPMTGQLSIDGVTDPVNKRVGLGLQIMADKLGAQSASSIYANYAYRLQLDAEDTQRLSFGIAAGVTQYGLNGAMLTPGSEGLDQTIPTGQINSFIPDFRLGIYYSNPKWYLGASIMDLLSGDGSDNIFRWDAGTTANLKRKRHLYVIAGTLFNLSEDTKLRPSLLVKEDFKGPTSVDLNAMLIFGDQFWIGGSYRTGAKLWNKEFSNGANLTNVNAVSAITQFYINSKLRIGYSYDYSLSKMSSVENGSHEITLGLTFGQKSDRIVSPRFF